MNAKNMSIGVQVAMSAVIGGTAEKLGGGKFANGAVTGAYVTMFNHAQKELQTSARERRMKAIALNLRHNPIAFGVIL